MIGPPLLIGSKYPTRLAYSQAYQTSQEVIEQVAELPVAKQIDLGYSLESLLVECKYGGVECNVRLVCGKYIFHALSRINIFDIKHSV